MNALKQIRPLKSARTQSRRTASERLEAIMPMLEFRLASTTGKRPVFVPGGFGQQTILTLDDLAGHIARKHGICRRTAWKWYCQFQQSSFTALANSVRADRGRSRYFAANSVARQLFADCFVKAMSAREIHEALCRELHGDAPSYATVRLYLNSTPNLVRELVRKRKARP